MRKILVLTCIAFSACMFVVPECVSGAPAKEKSVSVAVPSPTIVFDCVEKLIFDQCSDCHASSVKSGMRSCPFNHMPSGNVSFEETHKEGLWPVDS